ncbi:UDP-glucosyltransferase [Dorcoceras hygrometricum]|uniref:Glycosyltransferase n=1 Tax=Dorcoceras hygrometricum TaxID=472368 RepID=A0A2Z7A8D9_9LAMI|nr:UDP-glucosyltransferase [Dorcoceras hygrometricum]
MATQSHKLHFILFPLMAPGHMIPMKDIAKLLAQRGVVVTMITTPLNAKRFSPTIDRATESGLEIHLVEIRFPSSEAGLPEGCENLDSLPSLDLASNFFVALGLLQKQVGDLFEELEPRPNCLISDMGLPWTTQIAEKFRIPRIVFHGTCCFSLLCSHNIVSSKILDSLSSDSEQFEVPNLPDSIRLRKFQVTGSTKRDSSAIKDVTDQIRAAEKTSFGVVVNSFQELEAAYVKEYSKAKGERVWCIGPVSLCNKNGLDLVDRGNKASINEQDCLKWLNSQEPGSAIYASLGSLSRLIAPQMIELALGLEESNRPFIWSLGGGDKTGELDRWILENGFEERVNGRGLIIRGWAPQVLILSHEAIGGFLTHAGWNSTLEGISAGVPMVTWPLFAEQFCNEKLVVEVLKIGVGIGVETPVKWGEEEKVGVLVRSDDVKKALELLMDGGENGEERRRKARELAEMAKKAINGGSSYGNMTSLIEEIMAKSNVDETSGQETLPV